MERRPILGYGCSYCSKTFVNQFDLAQHEEHCKYIHETKTCPHCDGAGQFTIRFPSWGYDGSPKICTACHGTGRVRK